MNPSIKNRLKGWIRRRLKLSKRAWIQVDFQSFQKLTRSSDRQIRRAKKELESDSDLIFRTVLKSSGRGWSVLVTFARKDEDGREPTPFFNDKSGKNRRCRRSLRSPGLTDTPNVKESLRGIQFKETPLRRGFEKHPAFFKPIRKPSQGMIRLAHHLKREIETLHWDNSKVIFRPQHAFSFALRALKAGFTRVSILRTYENALKRRHGDATDLGLSTGDPKLCFEPSSTVSLAFELLNKPKTSRKQAEKGLNQYPLNKSESVSRCITKPVLRCMTEQFASNDEYKRTVGKPVTPPQYVIDGLKMLRSVLNR